MIRVTNLVYCIPVLYLRSKLSVFFRTTYFILKRPPLIGIVKIYTKTLSSLNVSFCCNYIVCILNLWAIRSKIQWATDSLSNEFSVSRILPFEAETISLTQQLESSFIWNYWKFKVQFTDILNNIVKTLTTPMIH